MTDYTIGEPVDDIPPIGSRATKANWSDFYQAARKAAGRWVPIDVKDSGLARQLAALAKRQQYDAEARKQVVYLRVRQ